MIVKKGVWPRDDGKPITCQEQIKILEENWVELEQVLRDAYDDAMLMDVSRDYFVERLHNFIDSFPPDN